MDVRGTLSTGSVAPSGPRTPGGRSGWRAASGRARWTSTAPRSISQAPFGSLERSGFGRERGRYGLEEYLVTKAIHH